MPQSVSTLTALVPAKGDSERVRGKNLRGFCGPPLLCRILGTLQEVDLISRIIVNTDSERVAKVAGGYEKVVIHERPESLHGHDVSMNAIIAHDIATLGPGHYLQTHATNPLVRSSTIAEAIRAYFAGLPEHDSLFSVIAHQSRFFMADGKAVNHNPAVLLNTQDLPPVYEENSCLYIFSDVSFLNNSQNRIGKSYQVFRMSKIESLDIDTEEDFLLAENAWKTLATSQSL